MSQASVNTTKPSKRWARTQRLALGLVAKGQEFRTLVTRRVGKVALGVGPGGDVLADFPFPGGLRPVRSDLRVEIPFDWAVEQGA